MNLTAARLSARAEAKKAKIASKTMGFLEFLGALGGLGGSYCSRL
jgi:hypothetical protein